MFLFNLKISFFTLICIELENKSIKETDLRKLLGNCAFINPSVIINELQIQTAYLKVLLNEKNEHLITDSIENELYHSLSMYFNYFILKK